MHDALRERPPFVWAAIEQGKNFILGIAKHRYIQALRALDAA